MSQTGLENEYREGEPMFPFNVLSQCPTCGGTLSTQPCAPCPLEQTSTLLGADERACARCGYIDRITRYIGVDDDGVSAEVYHIQHEYEEGFAFPPVGKGIKLMLIDGFSDRPHPELLMWDDLGLSELEVWRIRRHYLESPHQFVRMVRKCGSVRTARLLGWEVHHVTRLAKVIASMSVQMGKSVDPQVEVKSERSA